VKKKKCYIARVGLGTFAILNSLKSTRIQLVVKCWLFKSLPPPPTHPPPPPHPPVQTAVTARVELAEFTKPIYNCPVVGGVLVFRTPDRPNLAASNSVRLRSLECQCNMQIEMCRTAGPRTRNKCTYFGDAFIFIYSCVRFT